MIEFTKIVPDSLHHTCVIATWANMQNGDDGQPIELANFADRSVQVFGTFGAGGNVRIEGSIDGTNYAPLTDPQGNALDINHDELMGEPYAVVANLPYNVGTLLFTRWLGGESWPPLWTSLTLMFQHEVAQRIISGAGDDAYGRLAILAQWRSEAKLAMKVHRSAFTPPPKVMSAIVHVTPAPAPDGVSARMLERLTEAAFGQRRKMLRQSLKGHPGALDALAALGIDETRRAETLSVAEFTAVAHRLSA